jgi:hypothetical protein
MLRIAQLALLISVAFLGGGCIEDEPRVAGIQRTGFIAQRALEEASGIQAATLSPGVYFLHNDDSDNRIYAISESGADLGAVALDGSNNRDWEDITLVPSDHGPLLVIADVGDNFSVRQEITLYFAAEPLPDNQGRFSGTQPLLHQVRLSYPDGPRDCESVAYDAFSDRIYLVSKRDVPARIYSVGREQALAEASAALRYDGNMAGLRPPDRSDIRRHGRKGWKWVSQPTGLDIHPDGSRAALITYRSLYLFERREQESWPEAFSGSPVEFVGPPSRQEEAVAWAADGESIIVTSEKLPAPIYRFRPNPEP